MNDRITRFWDCVIAAISGPFRMLDEFMLVRRALLLWAAWIQLDALRWSYAYAQDTADRVGTAAVIGAVLGVVSALFGAAIKFYNDGRKAQESSDV